MDIQFSLFDSTLADMSKWPTQLRTYVTDLQSLSVRSYMITMCLVLKICYSLQYADAASGQPDTPMCITFENTKYILDSSSSVRQNVESFTLAGGSRIEAISESILDLEGNQKSMACQVCSW